jgi:glutamate carboxypeptidase
VNSQETLQLLRQQLPEITADLEQLVNAESPSMEKTLLAKCADVLDEIGTRVLGKSAQRFENDGWQHLLWQFGKPDVLLIGHYDTVWPANKIDSWPFHIDGDRATGPGVFDMKSGVVESIYAMAAGGVLNNIAILVTADEEIGSITSREVIESTAKQSKAALVLENSHHGAIKIGRKGVSFYEFEIEGKAAHAGLEPENGANTLVELAHRVLHAKSLENLDLGTTVNPTVAHVGTTVNVIPAHAELSVDVRAESKEEQKRVHDALLGEPTRVEGTSFKLTAGGMNRAPLETSASKELFAIAEKVAPQVGIHDLKGVTVGGGSDGNFTAAIGISTLDGLGAVGDGAHAEGEWASISAIAERGALVRGIVDHVLASGVS